MSSGRKSQTADFLGFVQRNNHFCSRLQLFDIINICAPRDTTSGGRESKLGTKLKASGNKIRRRRVKFISLAPSLGTDGLTPELLLPVVG